MSLPWREIPPTRVPARTATDLRRTLGRFWTDQTGDARRWALGVLALVVFVGLAWALGTELRVMPLKREYRHIHKTVADGLRSLEEDVPECTGYLHLDSIRIGLDSAERLRRKAGWNPVLWSEAVTIVSVARDLAGPEPVAQKSCQSVQAVAREGTQVKAGQALNPDSSRIWLEYRREVDSARGLLAIRDLRDSLT